MQIHEITTLNENFLSRMAKQARDDAFKKATGVDLGTRALAQTTTPTPTSAAPAATPTASKPAATTVTPVGFNASNVLNIPGVKQAAPAAPQSPEQIRKAKQAQAAQVAQDQMAGKTTAAPQPTATSAAPTEKPRFLKTATDKIADKAKAQTATVTPVAATTTTAPVNSAAAPVIYRYQGRPLNPSNPADATRIAQLQALGKTSG